MRLTSTEISRNPISMDDSKVYRSLLKYIPQEGMILDAGCGYFQYANYLKKYVNKVICLDLFIPDIASAQKNDFLLSTIESLPFKDNAFDFVYCLTVMQFIKDDMRAVNEFHRILKPGGTLLFTVPTSRSLFKLIRELEIACGVYRYPQFNVKGHRYYTRDQIRTLTEGKFTLISISGCNYNFMPRLFDLFKSILITILRFCRLNTFLRRIKIRFSKTDVINDTTNMDLSEEAKVELQADGKLSHLWDKFAFTIDLSYHYILVLKKL